MTKLFCLIAGLGLFSVRAGMAQNPPPQIDCKWLTVDSAAKTATLQLTAGLTSLNGGLNFDGFKDGGLTLTVPMNWNVVVEFSNNDSVMMHSAQIIDSVKPVPAGPMDPAFPRAQTVRLMQGLAHLEKDSFRFAANKAGTYMIFCAVPGHGLAGMWVKFKVSATQKQPTLSS
jgi:uncharacterized cupredoxin-like copper-binding protein